MRTRTWTPPYPLDLRAVLSPLTHGNADPTVSTVDGTFWRASTTEGGPVTLRIRGGDGDAVSATAWGDGADRALDGLPALLGANDDDAGFVAVHDVIADGQRRARGLRLTSCGRVWDVLVPAVLEQKVATREAWRSWRELCYRFGTAAPGPTPKGLRAPPDARRITEITDWQWHRCGIDGGRRRTLIGAARVAHRLERAAQLGGEQGRELLRLVPGIGAWTAAEIAQRAWGDPDAISVGDLHLSTVVGNALLGRPLDDEGMLAELAPYAGHRQRAVRYLGANGMSRPRFGPRLPLRDYRAM